MAEHDYMAEYDCPAWKFSDGTCCPAGTHKRDCGVIISHNNQRNSHAPTRPTMIEFIALATALSGVAYLILERILA